MVNYMALSKISLKPIPKSLIFLILFFSFFLAFVNTSPTHASNATKKASFSISGWSQGATLTKDYYVYTDWNGSSFVVKRCKRSSTSSCKTSSRLSGKPSSLYHEWDTGFFQAILKENKGWYCIKLSSMKQVSKSNCGSLVKSSGLSSSGDTKGYRQGWTKYVNNKKSI